VEAAGQRDRHPGLTGGQELSRLDDPVNDNAVCGRADVAFARDDFRLPEQRVRAIDFRSRLRGLPAAEAFAREREFLAEIGRGGVVDQISSSSEASAVVSGQRADIRDA